MGHLPTNRTSILALAAGLCALGTLANAQTTGARAFDPGYAYRPSSQRDPVPRRIHQLVSPTVVFPTLVRPGESFVAVLRVATGPDGKPLAAAEPSSWRVFLTVDQHTARCRVLEVKLTRAKQGWDLARLRIDAPATLARDLYDLRVVTLGLDDSQPNAVRVLGPRLAPSAVASRPAASSRPSSTGRRGFRFAVVTDHQLWDPAFKLLGKQRNAGAYPLVGRKRTNVGMARQGLHEIGLHDPDFVLHTGDLVFGLAYTKEYAEALSLLRRARLPVFAVPGNHDAYAIYTVRLHRRPLKLIKGAVICRKHLGGEGALSWRKAWGFLSCVYGDVKELLYVDLHRDGLAYWQRQFGPPRYAFDHEGFRFIGLNTYGGTPQRRHAFSIYVDAFDLHLGAPAVDNYGGYLTERELRWIERQAKQAVGRGLTPVYFGHHDPRGNPEGRRYHPNESFPTDPVSSAGFEEWNYDSGKWDSDPRDARKGESPERNSGVALVRILARYGGYYLSGHLHQDGRAVYAPGSRIHGKIAVKRPLQFIRTTTASSSVKGDSYWGYRLIEARDGKLTAVDHAPEHGLASVPAGNLWVGPVGAKGDAGGKKDKQGSYDVALAREVALTSGLPRPTEVVIRWALATRPSGYRFRLRPAPGSELRFDPALRPRVEEVAPRGNRQVFRVRVKLPAAKFPPTSSRLLRYRLRALAARDNHPPQGRIGRVGEWAEGPLAADSGSKAPVVDGGGRDGGARHGQAARDGGGPAPLRVLVNQPLFFSGERSSDPEGDRIIGYYWRLSGADGFEKQARGARLSHRFAKAGNYVARLTVVDQAGARSTSERPVIVSEPPPPSPRKPPAARRPAGGCGGCCAGEGVAIGGTAGVGMLLCGLLLVVARRRRRLEKVEPSGNNRPPADGPRGPAE